MASQGPGLSDTDSDSGDDVEILPRHLNERVTSQPTDDATLPPRKPGHVSRTDLGSGFDDETPEPTRQSSHSFGPTPDFHPNSRLSALPNLPTLAEDSRDSTSSASSLSRSNTSVRGNRNNAIRRRHTFTHRTLEKEDTYHERPSEQTPQRPSDLEDFITAAYFDLDLGDSEDSVLGGLPQSRLEMRPEDREMVDCEALRVRFDIEKRLGKYTYLVKSRDDKAEIFVLRVLDLNGRNEEDVDSVFETVKSLQLHTFHENLVKICDVIKSEERVYIITEYCEGGTLQALISRARHFGETLNVIEVCDWLVHMLRALAHLHTRPHLHLSLTSGNVFLKNNSVKIGECSELKRLRKSLQSETTPCDDGSGDEGPRCPSVMEHHAGKQTHRHDEGIRDWLAAPEVVSGNPPSAKSDIWSAGCLLYELCSQKHPFPSKTPEEFIQTMNSSSPPSLSELFPDELGKLYKRMVAVEASERPSADMLLRENYILDHIEDMDGDSAVWV